MNRRLLMLRHAKSDWTPGYGDDHRRPLAERGRRAARRIGRYLAAIDRVPDLVVSSSAVRALSTVELASQAGDWATPVEVSDDLYGAGPQRVLEVLRRQDRQHVTVLLAGHEPTWSQLTGDLIGGAHLRFPTAAVASVRFDLATWAEAEEGRGELEWLVTPKLLRRSESIES